MSPLQRAEQELEASTAGGTFLDPPLRRKVAVLIFRFLYEPYFPALAELDALGLMGEHPAWHRVFSLLFEKESLRSLTRANEDFSISVAQETLSWCRQVSRQFESGHPWQTEESLALTLPAQMEAEEDGAWADALEQFRRWYPAEEATWTFYQQQLGAAGAEMPFHERLILRRQIFESWQKHFQPKKREEEARFLEKALDQYLTDLSQKIARLEYLGELLSPFYNFLGMAWNQTLDAWNRLDWSQLETYAETLQRDPAIQQLAELLGRYRLARREREDIIAPEQAPRETWVSSTAGTSEITGIHQSSDLSALLPSEVALLSYPETEVLLALKYVEKKLITFQYASRTRSFLAETRSQHSSQERQQGQGPFILCLDSSGSMFGEPERVAKALALAILEIAFRQQRRAYVISFSDSIETLDFSQIGSQFSAMVEFIRLSFHGGTDIEPALSKILALVEEREWHQADVLVISDFVIPYLSRPLFERVSNLRQDKGVNFHSLYVSRRPDSRSIPLPIFDNFWVYDLDNPGLMRQAVDHFSAFDPLIRRTSTR